MIWISNKRKFLVAIYFFFVIVIVIASFITYKNEEKNNKNDNKNINKHIKINNGGKIKLAITYTSNYDCYNILWCHNFPNKINWLYITGGKMLLKTNDIMKIFHT